MLKKVKSVKYSTNIKGIVDICCIFVICTHATTDIGRHSLCTHKRSATYRVHRPMQGKEMEFNVEFTLTSIY